MCKKITFLILTICIFFGNASAQSFDPDEAFKEARTLAFDGKKTEAEQLLNKVVAKYPNYDEVRLFLATVYGWDEKYKLARKEFQILVQKDKTSKEYWVGYIKNEMWADQNRTAIELAKDGLAVLPNDFDITILKASAERNNQDIATAFKTIDDYLGRFPKDEAALKFKKELKETTATNSISIAASRDYFSQIYGQMHYYNIQFGKETKYGSVIGRYNLNQKFDTYGSQFEIDAYPSITNGMYGYLNVGYSNSSIFPGFRCGAQVYKSLPRGFEASVGFRSLKFGENYTNIYTGSVGKYFGNSFVFVVPYLIPSEEGLSKSATFTYRKYGANEEQFFGVAVGLGFSPEVNRFGLDAINQPIVSLKSQKLSLVNNFKVKSNKTVIGIGASIMHQESIFDPGQYFWVTSVNLAYTLNY